MFCNTYCMIQVLHKMAGHELLVFNCVVFEQKVVTRQLIIHLIDARLRGIVVECSTTTVCSLQNGKLASYLCAGEVLQNTKSLQLSIAQGMLFAPWQLLLIMQPLVFWCRRLNYRAHSVKRLR